MKKMLFWFSLFCSLLMQARAQESRDQDVLYFKNGGITRGLILSNDGGQVRIQTTDGNIFVYASDQISRIAREPRIPTYHYQKKGFMNYTELGPLVAGKTSIEGVTTAAFSFQTVNGYRFNQFAQLGLGVGADLYATQTIIPVFGSFRGDLGRTGTVIPFYFADLGYGVNITQASSNGADFKGGLLYAAGLGIKIPFNRSAGFLISLGYRYQKTAYNSGGSDKTLIYQRLAVRAGFFL